MRLDRYIQPNRILDLQSHTFSEALQEMLTVCPPSIFDHAGSPDYIHQELLKREANITTCLSSGIAIPHLRIKSKKPYLFVLGRCKQGLDYEDIQDYRQLKFVLLLLASETDKSYLKVLAALARIFHDKPIVHRLFEVEKLPLLKKEVLQILRGSAHSPKVRSNKFNQFILKEADHMARGTCCSTIMIFADTLSGNFSLPSQFTRFKTILVTQDANNHGFTESMVDETIIVRSYSNNRLSQLRSAVFIALSRGVVHGKDKICCVGGVAGSNQFDTLVVVEVEKEFSALFSKKKNILPDHIKPEVLERVLAIAMELGLEGREGRAVGTCFVVGDTKELAPFTKPLILNPFYGYKEEDRNILNPFMDETIKEFSSLDGAFVVSGDGVLESAGSLIHAPNYYKELPGGLGTRHAAALAISLAASCIAITVSSSTGQVYLFQRGEMFPLYDNK